MYHKDQKYPSRQCILPLFRLKLQQQQQQQKPTKQTYEGSEHNGILLTILQSI